MDKEKLNQALYDKMAAEQEEYRSWLLEQKPEEILDHSFEYSAREDILMEISALNLPAPQAEALLTSPSPLADIYKDFRNTETNQMEVVADCIEGRANKLMEKQREATRAIPLYQQSGEYAKEHGELDVENRLSHLTIFRFRGGLFAGDRLCRKLGLNGGLLLRLFPHSVHFLPSLCHEDT